MQENNISTLPFRTLCQAFFCKAQVAGWQISRSPTFITTIAVIAVGSGANTCIHKSKQFLVQGHPFRLEDYKCSKKFLRIVFSKKLDGLENHYINKLMGLCCEI